MLHTADDPQLTRLTVLVVDDDPAALRLTAKITSAAGYRVIKVTDGQEALDRPLTDCPDMVVTDWASNRRELVGSIHCSAPPRRV